MERPRGMVVGAGGLQLPTAATPQSVRPTDQKRKSESNQRSKGGADKRLSRLRSKSDRRRLRQRGRKERGRKETASCVKKTDRVAFPWSVRGHLRGHLETLNSLEIGVVATTGLSGALSNPINRTN